MDWLTKIHRAAAVRTARDGIAPVARAAGIPRETLSRFLHGHRPLSLPVAEKLANLLGFELLRRKES